MPNYLIAMHQPVGDPPPPEVLEPIMAELGKIRHDMDQQGAWVFSGGLHNPDASTVIRVVDGDPLITDGPYAEGKEHLGGFTVVSAPDLDAALGWGTRIAAASGLPIEVRPFRW